MDGSENRDCGLFTVLFEQYREPFTRFANSFVRDRAVSENLFVDALVDYWQRRGSLPEDTNVPAYLLTSVRNKALNHLRHQRIRIQRAFRPNGDGVGRHILAANINRRPHAEVQPLSLADGVADRSVVLPHGLAAFV